MVENAKPPVSSGSTAGLTPDKPFESHSLTALTQFLIKGVQPPSRVYVDRDDILQTRVFCNVSSPAQVLRVLVRMLRASDGQIVPIQFVYPLAGDRSSEFHTQQLMEGFILSVACDVPNQVSAGQYTFAAISLLRGAVSTDPVSETLFSGYCNSNYGIGYPERGIERRSDGFGSVRTIIGTTPAAGAEITETTPTNAMWQLMLFSNTFVTSAAAGNRSLQYIIDDGANELYRISTVVNEGPSLTFKNQLSPNGINIGDVGNNSLDALPIPLIMMPGYRVRTLTGGIQAGDQYSAVHYQVKEWEIDG